MIVVDPRVVVRVVEPLVMVETISEVEIAEPIPMIVVDPTVVVRVEEPLVMVETIADVVTADEYSTVIVDAYEIYGPVGTEALSPLNIVRVELESEVVLELEVSAAFAKTAKSPYGRRRLQSMVASW